MKQQSAFILVFSALLLSACGGSSDPQSGTTAVRPAVPAAPTFGDCAVYTPGVKYLRSNGDRVEIIQGKFEGSDAFALAEFRPNNTRSVEFYQKIEGGYVRPLGQYEYDAAGAFLAKSVVTGDTGIPLNILPGKSVEMKYAVMSNTSTAGGALVPENYAETFTFIGFEDVVLAGRTFANVCKYTIRRPGETTQEAFWLAKGFGLIRYETLDAQGAAMPGRRTELTSIISAP
ncbi:hypothetical protein [Janthinobacterium fluminis]|uniref:Lipoprotein n=1 Tax=Janthinobacterium fluminis TaxID=2987524 RepID=A0ABT5K7W7_9BURK|nr:hypothetical protein [Janthinobacterium fluminis]MDC8760513.1 hypothetical protein [Janthinobacterium fluminis]